MAFSFVKRLFSLLDFCALEGLTVQGLRYLVLDWNYRDQKLRRMVDIPEVALICCFQKGHTCLLQHSKDTF